MLDKLGYLELRQVVTAAESGTRTETVLFSQDPAAGMPGVLHLVTNESYLSMDTWPGYASRGKYSFWSAPAATPGHTVTIPRTVSEETTYAFELYYGSSRDPGNPAEGENVTWFKATFSASSARVQAPNGTLVNQMQRPNYVFFVYKPSPFGQIFMGNFSALSAYYDTNGLFEDDFIGLKGTRIIFAHLDDPYLYAACNSFLTSSGWEEFVTFLGLLFVALVLLTLWLFLSRIVTAIFDARREYDVQENAKKAAGPQGDTVVVYKRRYPRNDDFNYSRNQYPPLLY